MSNRYYTEEFKEEAIRLIKNRGNKVSGISEKLGGLVRIRFINGLAIGAVRVVGLELMKRY